MEFQIGALGSLITIILGVGTALGTAMWKLSASISRLSEVTKLLREDQIAMRGRLDTHVTQHQAVYNCPVVRGGLECPTQRALAKGP